MIKLTALAIAFALTSCLARKDHGGPYSYVGPIATFLAPGAAPGILTAGLRFTFKVDKTGKVITDSIDLKEPYWSGPVTIKLVGAQFSNGHLTGSVKVHNGTGTALEGLRFDVLDGTEEFKGDAGPVMIRPVYITRQAPLLLGDLPAGDDSELQPFDAGGVEFAPDGRVINVNVNISGLSFAGLVNLGPLTRYNVDTDANGKVYAAGGDRVVRTDAGGTNLTAIIRRDDTHGVAIDPTSGDIIVCAGNDAIIRYASDGGEKGRLTVDKDKIDPPTKGLRVDPKGRIYSGAGGGQFIQCIEDGKKIWTGGNDSDGLFDVDAGQNLYQVTSNAVTVYDKDGREVKRFASGTDWHLGQLLNPVSCRVDKAGQVYVLESGTPADESGAQEYPRISVFDGSGRIVRVFGRGGKNPGAADNPPSFQVMGAEDLAFGPNGRVYILGSHLGTDTWLYMFDPF